MNRRRRHQWLADGVGKEPALLLHLIGLRPKDLPSLLITHCGDGKVLATIEHPTTLRSIARRILESLEDE